MSTKEKILSLLLTLAYAGTIIGSRSGSDILYFICKPLLMICIAAIFISGLNKLSGIPKLILSAFFFSWLGDIFLMFDAPIFFMLGLIAFLTAHIIYILSFTKALTQKNNILLKHKFYLALPFYLLAVCIFLLLRPNLNTLMIPVLIYTLVITTMVVSALNLYQQIPKNAWLLIFFGAISFMVSDISLAFNKFYTPFPHSAFIIMSTYVIAQYLIMKGSLVWLNTNSKEY